MFKKKKLLGFALPLLVVVITAIVLTTLPAGIFACGTSSTPAVEKPEEEEPVEKSYDKNPAGFTELLYNELLGREAGENEINYWNQGMASGAISPAFVVSSFLLGQEGQKIYGGYNDAQFVDFLYDFLLNREPDTEGYNSWIAMMSSGAKRDEIINAITGSAEFANQWKEYGVTK